MYSAKGSGPSVRIRLRMTSRSNIDRIQRLLFLSDLQEHARWSALDQQERGAACLDAVQFAYGGGCVANLDSIHAQDDVAWADPAALGGTPALDVSHHGPYVSDGNWSRAAT